MKVEFTDARTGRTKAMPRAHAEILQKLGRGTYMTRDMAAERAPAATPAPTPAPAPAPAAEPPAATGDPAGEFVIRTPDGETVLDGLGKQELHELAERLGVKVHHLAGVEKVRTALTDAFPA